MAKLSGKEDDFVHLHTHSDMSQLDGCGKISAYVGEAVKRGNKAIAITDHGTIRGYMKQYEACKFQKDEYNKDIKPIYGVEFYVCNDMHRKGLTQDEKDELSTGRTKVGAKEAIAKYEMEQEIRKRWHLTVHAENMEGMKNLFKLTSKSYIDGFYYKPRIDMETLLCYSKGLIVSSGCMGSVINGKWLDGKKKQALETAEKLYEALGDRFLLEMQPHPIREQRDVNKLAISLRKRFPNSKLVATQDSHYVHKGHACNHEVLLCIGTNGRLSDPNRFKFDGDEFHMRTRREMIKAFHDYHEFVPDELIKEALNSTIVVAERCNVALDVDYRRAFLPNPGMPEQYGDDPMKYLKALCVEGWAWRDMTSVIQKHAAKTSITFEESLKEYRDRLVHELTAINRKKFGMYFVIIHDLYNWARGQDIMVGPGRGSVAGCLIAYLMGITAVDPIEHGLIFERFINPERIDMPDIDMDFEDTRRQEVFSYIREKYGVENVCQISTIGKLSGKQCLKDVSRVLEVPYAAVNQVTASIIERSSGDERASQTIKDSFDEFEVCREFNKRYPDVLKHAIVLEGMAKNMGIHAAGVVASPVPIMDLIPLEIRKSKGENVIVSAADMYGVAAAGLVKLDVLGLRTLTVLKQAALAVKERHGIEINFETAQVGLDDPLVLKGFTDHDYGGVFQYDTPGADKVCTGVSFDAFDDVVAMTALNRPGTSRSGLAARYVDRKKNPEKALKDDFHPAVTEITKDTLGIIVFQEHVIRIFTDIAGFAPGTADSLRKTMAKKIGDETLGRERKKFVEGAWKKIGMDPEISNRIMNAITFFGSYGFNRSHAVAYSMISCWCMWMKVYYPLEFYWSLLKSEPDRIRVQQFAKHAKKRGIDFLPPSVNTSKAQFSIDPANLAIRGSLVDIKGVGEKAANAIVREQPYKSFVDFLARVDRRKVHRGVVVALARSGALDTIVPNTRWLVENIEDVWGCLGKSGPESGIFAEKLKEQVHGQFWDSEERMLIASKVSPLAFGRHPMDAYGAFIKDNVTIKLAPMSEDDFYKKNDNKTVMIGGLIVEVKLNQIGDFHTGELPDEETRRRAFWGKRYANVNIEDVGGVQNRVKFDWDIYPEMRPLIELGVGTPVLAMVSVRAQYENMRAYFAVDLEGMRKKIINEEELNIWERIITGDHPVKYVPAKSKEVAMARWTNAYYRKNSKGGFFYGVVTSVKLKCDKNGQEMAFFGLIGGNGLTVEAVCFHSQWPIAQKAIIPGAFIKIELSRQRDKQRGESHIFNGGVIKKFKIANKKDKE